MESISWKIGQGRAGQGRVENGFRSRWVDQSKQLRDLLKRFLKAQHLFLRHSLCEIFVSSYGAQLVRSTLQAMTQKWVRVWLLFLSRVVAYG